MITRPAGEWQEDARSMELAAAVTRLSVSYNEAIAATFKLHGVRLIELGGRRTGRSWDEIVSAIVLDCLSAFGLFGILKVVRASEVAGLSPLALGTSTWAKSLHLVHREITPLLTVVVAGVAWLWLIHVLQRRELLAKKLVGPMVRRWASQRVQVWQSSIVVVGRLVWEEVTRRVRLNLNKLGGSLSAGIPLSRQSAAGGQVSEATKALQRALQALQEVRKNTSDFSATRSPWSKLLDHVPWKEFMGLAPTAGLSWGLLGLWGGLGLCLAWTLAYHLLAILGLAFYDSAVRTEMLFEGFSVGTSDNVRLTDTPISRQESHVYRLLGIPAPSVEPWAFTFWPTIHPVMMIVIILSTFFLWYESSAPTLLAQVVVFMFGADILFAQWRFLIRAVRRLVVPARSPGLK